MKIPKYIDKALKQRTRYAVLLNSASCIVNDFLMENKIEPDEATWLSGCMIYCEPYAAEASVRRAIEEANNDTIGKSTPKLK